MIITWLKSVPQKGDRVEVLVGQRATQIHIHVILAINMDSTQEDQHHIINTAESSQTVNESLLRSMAPQPHSQTRGFLSRIKFGLEFISVG